MIYNQFLLTELIIARAKAEQEQQTQKEVLRPLTELGISLDDLVISGDSSLQEVFHSSTVYHAVQRTNPEKKEYFYTRINRSKGRLEPAKLTLEIFQISVRGAKAGTPFQAALGHKDIVSPFQYDKTSESLQILEQLESYLLRRQAEQQPKYLHTYRTKTEIKLPKLK